MKTVLFVGGRACFGGLETLAARMSSWFAESGCSVIYMTPEDGPAKSFFDKRVRWLVVDEADFEQLKWRGPGYGRRFCRKHFGPLPIDLIICLRPSGLWIAGGLLNGFGYPSALLAGVWTPHDYSLTGLKGLLVQPASHLFRSLAPESRLFMTEEVKRDLRKTTNENVDGFVWPLPVDGKKYSGLKREPKRGLIVSVGRIDDMKTYNWHSVEIVQQLLSRGYDVHWDIYGDGTQRAGVEAQIKKAGLQDRIQLRGSIEYHKMAGVLAEAQVFVGMGTSLIEAGFCRVPSICAIAENPASTTHGFLHEMPGFVCGDPLDQPVAKIADRIAELMDLSPAEYSLVESKTLEHVRRFEQEKLMPQLMECITRIPKTSRVWRPGWLFLVGKTAVWVYSGPFRRAVQFFRAVRGKTPLRQTS